MISLFKLDNLTEEPLKVGIINVGTSSLSGTDPNIFSLIQEASTSGEHDIVVAPEYSFLPPPGPLQVPELSDYLQLFKESSNETLIIPGTFIWKEDGKLRNSCYAFYNGEIIHQHSKIKNGGEIKLAEKYGLQYQPGDSLRPFTWKGLKLGIEICAEVESLARSGVRDLDLVFLIACGMNRLEYSMAAVHQKGYGVLADGDSKFYFAGDRAEFLKRRKKRLGF